MSRISNKLKLCQLLSKKNVVFPQVLWARVLTSKILKIQNCPTLPQRTSQTMRCQNCSKVSTQRTHASLWTTPRWTRPSSPLTLATELPRCSAPTPRPWLIGSRKTKNIIKSKKTNRSNLILKVSTQKFRTPNKYNLDSSKSTLFRQINAHITWDISICRPSKSLTRFLRRSPAGMISIGHLGYH